MLWCSCSNVYATQPCRPSSCGWSVKRKSSTHLLESILLLGSQGRNESYRYQVLQTVSLHTLWCSHSNMNPTQLYRPSPCSLPAKSSFLLPSHSNEYILGIHNFRHHAAFPGALHLTFCLLLTVLGTS